MKFTINKIFKYKKVFFLLGILFLSTHLTAQEVTQEKMEADFEKFMNKKEKEFQNFKDERDRAIAEFLKKSWIAVTPNEQKAPTVVPTPPVQPKIIPPAPKQENISAIPMVKIAVKPLPDKASSEIPKQNNIEKDKDNNDADKEQKERSDPSEASAENALPLNKKISFFNVPITIHYENKMLYHNETINENGVSNYWSTLGQSNFPTFLKQINTIGQILQFNDWGYYELINKVGDEILKDENDKVLFNFFMLSHLKYDVKVGKRNNKFILLVPFENEVYKKGFTTINDRNYYIMGDDSDGQIFTFKQNFAESNKPFDLNVSKTIRLGSDYANRAVYLKKYDTTFNIVYNKNIVEYNNEVPMSELSVFFAASMDPNTEASLVKPLSKLIQNKNELDAVNIILDFVQNSFEYKTDRDQFGYEKFFYPEDMFYYKYSDCEDRAVLFAHLVKKLLSLEVIGLEYKTHVATAVKFNAPINGDGFKVGSDKYIICDPTYLGASAGMTMPQFQNEMPTIIKF